MQNSDYHIPVLLQQSISGLNIHPSGVYVDATFGGGGHAKEILKLLDKGQLIAFDQDEEAQKNRLNSEYFLFVRSNFKFLKNFLRYHGYPKVDGILADLGVSSRHFDSAERGFSFRMDSPLDMRMNQEAGITAADVVNKYEAGRLKQVFENYAQLHNANKITKAIVKARSKNKIKTSSELLEIVKELVPERKRNTFLAKIFQALRIEVNQEVEALKKLLEQARDCLHQGGRLVIISYHSIEDRLVKNFIKNGKFYGQAQKDIYGNVNVPFKAINRKVITPEPEEIKKNNRARSAKLRIAEKL